MSRAREGILTTGLNTGSMLDRCQRKLRDRSPARPFGSRPAPTASPEQWSAAAAIAMIPNRKLKALLNPFGMRRVWLAQDG
jgi:hypothetical protein